MNDDHTGTHHRHSTYPSLLQATQDSEDLSLQPKKDTEVVSPPSESPSLTVEAEAGGRIKQLGPRPIGSVPMWQVVAAVVVVAGLLALLVPRLIRLRRRPKSGKRTE